MEISTADCADLSVNLASTDLDGCMLDSQRIMDGPSNLLENVDFGEETTLNVIQQVNTARMLNNLSWLKGHIEDLIKAGT